MSKHFRLFKGQQNEIVNLTPKKYQISTIAINSFLDITFKIHDAIQKVLNKLYAQFCRKILNFKGAAMVQPPSSAGFFIKPLYEFVKLVFVKVFVKGNINSLINILLDHSVLNVYMYYDMNS